MPGLSGTDVARELSRAGPAIVFVTAYDRYAIEAFELRALDYLLKPFDEERLAETVTRLRGTGRPPGAPAEIGAALERTLERREGSDRMLLTSGNRTLLERVADFDRIEAQGKVLHVHIGSSVLTTPGPLGALEEKLDPRRFVRVSRSTIVNLDRVAEVQPWFAGDYVLILQYGTRVTTARGYRARLELMIGKARR